MLLLLIDGKRVALSSCRQLSAYYMMCPFTWMIRPSHTSAILWLQWVPSIRGMLLRSLLLWVIRNCHQSPKTAFWAQFSCLLSTLETTFDTTVTTEVNGRGLPALTTRSSPMAWRLGQSQPPRLQAGDAPSMPSSYATPRGSTTGSSTTAGRYSGHSDPSRLVNSTPCGQRQ